MSVLHGARLGDPEPVTTTDVSTSICNCACSLCLSGTCCQFAPRTWQYPTVQTASTATITVNSCSPTQHDFAVLNPKRLFCRKCGSTRDVA